jgi:hypothetical protein
MAPFFVFLQLLYAKPVLVRLYNATVTPSALPLIVNPNDQE